MLKDLSALLDAAGFRISPGIGEAGDYVVEKAFAVR
jgi:ferredoxin--NADP+ reductase